MFDDLRDRLQRLRTRWRRHRLLMAYAKVGRVRHGLGPGFTPTMYAYDQLTSEGLMVAVEKDGEHSLEWLWPETTADELTTDGGVDRECPECGRDAVTVVDVQAYGGNGYGARIGDVCLDRLGEGYGGGWRLYCHATTEDGDSA